MSSWHVEDRDLRRWLAHNTALATSVSIEQHLVSCDGCIDRVGALSRQDSALDAELEHGWERVRDAVELHRPSWLERGLTTVGLPAHEAQLVAAARAFRGPLLVAVLVVLVFAELAGQFGQARGEFFFLLVAPLLPSAAVAFAYDPELEPALEQELCTPYPPARLVVLRTIAVLALAIPVAVLLGLVLPGPISFLWLLPAAGFVAADLALSTWISPLRGVAVISGVWSVTVWVTAHHSSTDAALHGAYPSVYLVLVVVSVAVFARRAGHVRGAYPGRSSR
jgi:hypothetical protein